MPIKAFTDGSDGYYEVEVPDGESDPAWTSGLTTATVASQEPAALLSDAKTARIAVMKAAHDAAVADGFTTNSILMQADEDRVSRLKGGYDLAILEGEATMGIIDQANTLHETVLVAVALTMIRALGVNVRTLLFQFNARRTSINAAENVAAVNEITW